MASKNDAPDWKAENPLWRSAVLVLAWTVIVVGIVLLARLFNAVLEGSIADHVPRRMEPVWARPALALVLRLPIPLHVISVGLILQRRYLSPVLARSAWIAVVVSGCWLGAALAVRLFLQQIG